MEMTSSTVSCFYDQDMREHRLILNAKDYQPGIGTYVTKANGSMSRTSRLDKFKSWYAKAKDSAIGV